MKFSWDSEMFIPHHTEVMRKIITNEIIYNVNCNAPCRLRHKVLIKTYSTLEFGPTSRCYSQLLSDIDPNPHELSKEKLVSLPENYLFNASKKQYLLNAPICGLQPCLLNTKNKESG